jgi:transposase
LASINLIKGYTNLGNYKTHFDYSYYSECYDDVRISKNTVAEFLLDIGSRTEKVDTFYDLLISKSTNKFTIDGHCISNYSEKNCLAKYGNKYQQMKSKQVNLLVMLDIVTKYPLMTHMFDGSELDKTSIKNFLKIRKIKNALLVLDSGFYSKENIKIFKESNNNYVIPLSENLTDYKNAAKELKFEKDFSYGKDSGNQRMIDYFTIESDDKIIGIFRDNLLAEKLKAEYSDNLKKGIKGHTQEFYDEHKTK